MNLILGRASLLSFLAVAAMSMRTVNAGTLGPANGLWNTGVQADDTTPITPGTADLNYTVTFYNTGGLSGPPPPSYLPTSIYYGTPVNGPAYASSFLATDPNATPAHSEDWVGNQSNAQWLTYSNTLQSETGGPFDQVSVYQLVLSGIPIPPGAQVSIGGFVAADDDVTIYGNGKEIYTNYIPSETGMNNETNYNSLNSLASAATFTAGTSNTLDFVVTNAGGYTTGFLAELTGSYTLAVPEPTSVGLMILGGMTLLALGRKKLKMSKAKN